MRFRAATTDDVEALARGMVEGMSTYVAFAREGWRPPEVEQELEGTRAMLEEEDGWCLVAEHAGEIVGQVGMRDAAGHGAHPAPEPGLAHLRNLFVREDHWGTGLAGALHARVLDAARERGFTSMRLFTPAHHARARRFYEREGWCQHAPEFHEPHLGLDIVEYRIGL